MFYSRMTLAMCLALAASPVLAQSAVSGDVVMRRPLPMREGSAGQDGVTPAPSPTPPSVDCPEGHVCTVPDPSGPTSPPPNSGYGWYVHCGPPELADCEQVTERQDPQFGTVYDYQSVDQSLCRQQQSAAGRAVVEREGYDLPAGEAYDFTAMCSKPVYVAIGMCNGTLSIDCGLIDPTTGAGGGGESIASCISQRESDPAYQSLISMLPQELRSMIIAPDDIASRNGESCSSGRTQETVTGVSCGDVTRQCQQATYSYDLGTFPPQNVTLEAFDVIGPEDDVRCTSASYNATQMEAMQALGMTPYGQSCGTGSGVDAYVARGRCTTSVTSGQDQTQVDTVFDMQCFAVSGWGGNSSISQVDSSLCDVPATPQQQAVIDQVAQTTGTYQDPKRLDRSCSAGSNGSIGTTNPDGSTVNVRLNYQRDTVPLSQSPDPNASWSGYPDPPPGSVDFFRGSGGAPYYLVESKATYPYVCTDVDRGTGWRPAYFENMGVASTYPVTRWPCAEERYAFTAEILAQDIQQSCRDTLPSEGQGRASACMVDVQDDNAGRMTITYREWMAIPW